MDGRTLVTIPQLLFFFFSARNFNLITPVYLASDQICEKCASQNFQYEALNTTCVLLKKNAKHLVRGEGKV